MKLSDNLYNMIYRAIPIEDDATVEQIRRTLKKHIEHYRMNLKTLESLLLMLREEIKDD